MQEVRERDRKCRFPLCACGRFRLRLEVSHQKHRGMGGNPSMDRTTPESMILVCSARHKENRVSLDRGTLRWRALSDRGAEGPVAWDVDLNALGARQGSSRPQWREVARELAPHRVETPTSEQMEVLLLLAQMLL